MARTASSVLYPARQPRHGALPLPANKPPPFPEPSRQRALRVLLSSVTELRHQPGRFLGRERLRPDGQVQRSFVLFHLFFLRPTPVDFDIFIFDLLPSSTRI
ncbi:uncharacterized protein TrAtP1_005009 [Trichoderma atroviride]|uniref:uncharacterized protein n=1 Tax=Hypocrea atroviridis TaxID=63577 RepID=UPI003330AB50|nr:hypothetical protein TrAtP1_005009 [Trichoderma atroviride]